jgi:DNA invertase Pin-like site-specific DNA recombinase/transposase
MDPTLRAVTERKIDRDHQARLAVVYVRQSTVHQVQHHQESTQLQYGLVDQAYRLGWPRERILVIDEDLGLSGASAEARQGFQRLLSEVALNQVGLILGVEMSRFARSCKDWYQLLELCALFRTLIADLDGLYDPTNYNDRLLLGLKGTMSEAELHILKQRMLQGARQKAKRGELVSKVPIGYVRTAGGDVQLDPDEQAQTVVRTIFAQFRRLGSASAVLRCLVQQQVKLPVREDSGPHKGQLCWRRPSLTTVRNILTHPMYAGAYAYGRTCQNPTTRRVQSVPQRLPREAWPVLLQDRYARYITWDEYERNVAQLAENRSLTQTRGVPRRGRALLAGLLRCGRCGFGMSTRYQGRASQPRYLCETGRALYGAERCQGVAARAIDEEVMRLALLALTPAALDVSLRVTADVEQQRADVDAQWRQRLERARYETDRARRQFEAVEPEHRLVARTLEANWEGTLRHLDDLERQYARFQSAQPRTLTVAEREQIRGLAEDLPRLWHASSTTDEDRKVILRQLIERVIVQVEEPSEWVELRIEWAGGQQTYSRIRRPVASLTQLSYWPEMAQRLKELKAKGLSSREIAAKLQQEGVRSAKGGTVTPEVIRRWLSRYGLTAVTSISPAEKGNNEWTIAEIARRFQISVSTIHGWIRRSRVTSRQLPDRRRCWIITASEIELQNLIHDRRRPRRSVNTVSDATSTSHDKAVTRGVL